jgi:hypothetical protein
MALLLVLAACGDDSPAASTNSGATGCSEITAEVVTLWDSVLDRIDADPTLMSGDIPESDVIQERSFDLGVACGIDGGNVAFSEILLHLHGEAEVRPASTAVIIAALIHGMCQVDAMEWSAAAQTVCDS